MTHLPISVDSEVMSGIPCFKGTRVPLKTLLDYLEGGYTISEFLNSFPTVERAHVDAFLYLSAAWMIEGAREQAKDENPIR